MIFLLTFFYNMLKKSILINIKVKNILRMSYRFRIKQLCVEYYSESCLKSLRILNVLVTPFLNLSISDE